MTLLCRIILDREGDMNPGENFHRSSGAGGGRNQTVYGQKRESGAKIRGSGGNSAGLMDSFQVRAAKIMAWWPVEIRSYCRHHRFICIKVCMG